MMDLTSKFEIKKWEMLIPELDRNELEELANNLVQQNEALKQMVKQLPFMFSEDYGTATDDGGNGVEDMRRVYEAWGIVLPQG